MNMTGTRVRDLAEAKGEDGRYIPGAYWPGRTMNDGCVEWWIVDPAGHIGRLATGIHEVTEHEDGTITVDPSIVSTLADHGHEYHGWLRHGEWTDA